MGIRREIRAEYCEMLVDLKNQSTFETQILDCYRYFTGGPRLASVVCDSNMSLEHRSCIMSSKNRLGRSLLHLLLQGLDLVPALS